MRCSCMLEKMMHKGDGYIKLITRVMKTYKILQKCSYAMKQHKREMIIFLAAAIVIKS